MDQDESIRRDSLSSDDTDIETGSLHDIIDSQGQIQGYCGEPEVSRIIYVN